MTPSNFGTICHSICGEACMLHPICSQDAPKNFDPTIQNKGRVDPVFPAEQCFRWRGTAGTVHRGQTARSPPSGDPLLPSPQQTEIGGCGLLHRLGSSPEELMWNAAQARNVVRVPLQTIKWCLPTCPSTPQMTAQQPARVANQPKLLICHSSNKCRRLQGPCFKQALPSLP